MTTCAEGNELQPVEPETTNVYVPAFNPGIVVVVPVPVVLTFPGERVKVQFSDAGSPDKATLAVDDVQLG